MDEECLDGRDGICVISVQKSIQSHTKGDMYLKTINDITRVIVTFWKLP